MTRVEVEWLTDYVAAHPRAGDEIPGSGGFRKLRIGSPDRNMGKRGAFRTITFYSGTSMPVFLITVFAKNAKANLSAAETKALKVLGKDIADSYAAKPGRPGSRK